MARAPVVSLLGALAVVVACGPRGARTPEAAFDQLAGAAHGDDAPALFDLVDDPSRWSAASIFRYEREIAELVERGYPPGPRARELARVARAIAAADERAYLAGWIAERDALRPFREAGGRARVERRGEGEALVHPTRGAPLRFGRDPYGRWGWRGLADELEAAKQRASQAVEATRENARLYARGGAP